MLQKITAGNRTRAPRFSVNQEILVASKTIGTALSYTLATENVSKSGMLLTWQYTTPVPFSENTILEMTIDPDSNILDEPVSCLGKVVRRVHSAERGTKKVEFGIRIVQIDHSDMDNWELCIEDLALKAAELVSEDVPHLDDEEKDGAKPPEKKYRHAV